MIYSTRQAKKKFEHGGDLGFKSEAEERTGFALLGVDKKFYNENITCQVTILTI